MATDRQVGRASTSKQITDRVLTHRRSNDGRNLRRRWVLPEGGQLNRRFTEPMTGIEPAYSAWEARSAPER
jgi:hypothetical protein